MCFCCARSHQLPGLLCPAVGGRAAACALATASTLVSVGYNAGGQQRVAHSCNEMKRCKKGSGEQSSKGEPRQRMGRGACVAVRQGEAGRHRRRQSWVQGAPARHSAPQGLRWCSRSCTWACWGRGRRSKGGQWQHMATHCVLRHCWGNASQTSDRHPLLCKQTFRHPPTMACLCLCENRSYTMACRRATSSCARPAPHNRASSAGSLTAAASRKPSRARRLTYLTGFN